MAARWTLIALTVALLGAGEPRAVAANPTLAATRIRDGDALMKDRRYREATFAFLDASHADPRNVEALFKLGNAFAVLGYYERAVERWERVVELATDEAVLKSARDNMTKARARIAQVGPSPQAAGQAPGGGPVAEPTRTQARRAYEDGVNRILARDYGGAVQSLTQAIQLEPTLAVAFTARGSAYVGLRRYADAVPDYQYALKLDPGQASPLYGLGEVLRKLGRTDEARAYYTRYLESSAPDVQPERKAEVRQTLDRLR
ncbi:tetratricopeptide repeat protein [Myxococcaceae bacterium GXIMD 01537]